MKNNYDSNSRFNSGKYFGASIELSLENYSSLLKKKETSLTNFETFLKSKVENSGNSSPISAQKISKIPIQMTRKKMYPTNSLGELPNNLQLGRVISSMATSRLPKESMINSSRGFESQNETPKGLKLFFIKNDREIKQPLRLIKTSRKVLRSSTSRVDTESKKPKKKNDLHKIQAMSASPEKRDYLKEKDVSPAGKVSPSLAGGCSPSIQVPENNSDHKSHECSFDKLSLEHESNNFQCGSQPENIYSSQQGLQKSTRLATLEHVPEDQNEKGDKNIQGMKLSRKIMSLQGFSRSIDLQRERSLTIMQSRTSNESPVSPLKIKECRSAAITESTQHFTEESHTRTPLLRPKKSRINSYRENLRPSATEVSQLTTKRKTNNYESQDIVHSYLPDWLTTRYDFKKAFENKESNAKRFIINACSKNPVVRTEEEIEVVARWLQKIKLFKGLASQLLESIAKKVTHHLYHKDEALCFQGEPGDCLYIIFEGLVRCVVNRHDVAMFKTYDTPGQKALESSAPRTATLIAAVPTHVLRLEREDYCTLLNHYINQQKAEYLAVIDEVPILKDLIVAKKQTLASRLQSKIYSAGEVIYNKGEAAESMYILKSGKIQIRADVEIEKRNLWPSGSMTWEGSKVARNMKFKEYILPCQYFGEMELINKCDRVHTVTCVQSSQVLVLNKNYFIEIFDGKDINNFKEALKRHVLQDQNRMRKELEENEVKKKKLRDVVVTALKHHLSELQPKPKGQTMLETTMKIFKNEVKKFYQDHVAGPITQEQIKIKSVKDLL